MKKSLVLSALLLLFHLYGKAQTLEQRISLNYTDISLEELLKKITDAYQVEFSYSKDIISLNKKVTINIREKQLEEALKSIFKETGIVFNVIGEQIVLRKEERKDQPKAGKSIQGRVTDETTGKGLSFATVGIIGKNLGVITNIEGEFVLNFTSTLSNDSLKISFIGYKTKIIPISSLSNASFLIALQRDLVELETIEVKPQSAVAILRAAIAKIPQNYSLKPYRQQLYLRNWTWLEGEPIEVAESIYDVYRGDVTEEELKKQVRLIKGRKKTNQKKYQEILKAFPALNSFGMGINAYFVFNADLTKFIENDNFLGKSGIDRHNFSFGPDTYYDGREVIVIDYDQKDLNKPLFKGSIYIDAYSLAIIKITQKISPKGLKYAPFFGPKVLEKVFGLGENVLTNQSFSLQYKEINGKWYLDYLTQDQEAYLIKTKRKFNRLVHSKTDMVITDTETDNVLPFPDSSVSDAKALMYKQYGEYDEDFWESQNIIKPDKNFNTAYQRIRLKTSEINSAETKTAEGGPDKGDNGTADLHYVDLDLTKKSKHFTFSFSRYDTSIIDSIAKKLEENYERIKADLKVKKMPTVEVRIYPSIETYHTAINNPNAADWMAGSAGINEINMVSPLNPGPFHASNPQMILDGYVHEFAHCVHIHMMNNNLGWVKSNDSVWLWEAIAGYETYASVDSSQLKQVKNLEYLKAGQYPTLEELNNVDNGKIYDLGYFLIDYIKSKWGMNLVIRLVKSNGDIEKLLKVNEKMFEEGFHAFLKEKYKI